MAGKSNFKIGYVTFKIREPDTVRKAKCREGEADPAVMEVELWCWFREGALILFS